MGSEASRGHGWWALAMWTSWVWMAFGATNSGHELEVFIGNEVMKEAANVRGTPSGGRNRSTRPGLKGSHSVLLMLLSGFLAVINSLGGLVTLGGEDTSSLVLSNGRSPPHQAGWRQSQKQWWWRGRSRHRDGQHQGPGLS